MFALDSRSLISVDDDGKVLRCDIETDASKVMMDLNPLRVAFLSNGSEAVVVNRGEDSGSHVLKLIVADQSDTKLRIWHGSK